MNVDKIRAALDVVLSTCDINAEVDSKLQAIRAMLDEPAEVEAVVESAEVEVPAWPAVVEGDDL